MDNGQKIKSLLWSLGAGGSILGIDYLAEGIERIIADRSNMFNITKGIYMVLADKHGTHWKNIEKDMRTAINMIWSYGNRELLNEIAGCEFKRKPRNSTFMEMIADYITTMRDGAPENDGTEE